jgi:hypothetical protein
MIGQDASNAAINDIRRYFFQQALPNEHHFNQRIAREIIVRYGSEVPIEEHAFGMIVEYLTLQPSRLEAAFSLNTALTLYEHALDIVATRGVAEGTVALQKIIKFCKDEDVVSFATLALAQPTFIHYAAQHLLLERLERAVGTSCRMALALALFESGEEEPIRELIRGKYLPDYEAAPENRDLNKYELQELMGTKFSQFILRKLLQDIATNGMGVTGPLGPAAMMWERNVRKEAY